MRFVFAATLFLAFFIAPSRADIAPPYPEFHAGIAVVEGDPYPTVKSVAKNSSAEKAGVKPGDKVLSLNGSYSKTDAPFYFWAKALRGPQDSALRLVVLRDDVFVDVIDVKRNLPAR